MINFALFGQPTKTNDQTTVYLRINQASEKIRISTKITIPSKNWNQATQTVVKGGDFDLAFYREKLTKIVNTVESIVRTANLENWELENVQREVAKLFGKNTVKSKGVLSLYYEWATVGTVSKTNPRRQDKQTYSVFKEFVGGKDIPFINVDYKFYSDFVLFLRSKKEYKENTVGTHIKKLKAVMSEGLKRKLHNNTDFLNFTNIQEEIININLTEQEIANLQKCKLNGQAEQVRDIFVLGCYVAQRHSDYSRISKKDIQGDYLVILQQKTKHRITIPLHPIAKEILEKYNGELPKISQTIFNRTIKEIAKFAKIRQKVFVREIKGGKTTEKYVEKWELISSHTARKSGVTNALRAGVPLEDCMYLAGIKSETVFRRYVGISDNEYTERLANSTFFTGSDNIEDVLRYATKVMRSGENPEWLKRLKYAYEASLRKNKIF